MAKESTVAPKERVNIVYKPATDAQEEVELPLKMLMVGDYTGTEDGRLIEERKPVSVDKTNFNDVLAAHNVKIKASVPNKLSQDKDAGELSVSLNMKTMRDFDPDQLAEQVPELKQLLKVREALVSLKGPLGNLPSFRKELQATLDDKDKLAALYQELNLEAADKAAPKGDE